MQAFTRHCTLWLSCTAHKTNDHQWNTKYAHTAVLGCGKGADEGNMRSHGRNSAHK
jgi:hypothetical protein